MYASARRWWIATSRPEKHAAFDELWWMRMAIRKKKAAGKKPAAVHAKSKPAEPAQSNPGSGGAMVVAADGFVDNADLPRGFNWRGFDAYLFDIDGTLLNSRDAVHYFAFLTAMSELYGREVGLEGVPVHGSTDPIILLRALERAGVSEADGRAALQDVMSRMCSVVEARAEELRPELCGSIAKLLAELKASGKLMGVTSGNVE